MLGPLGGMCICPPSFLRLFRRGRKVREIIRTLLLRLWKANLFYRLSRKYADELLFIDYATMARLGDDSTRQNVFLETAIPTELESSWYDSSPAKEDQFVFAGVLEPRKGWEIALRAYHQAFLKSDHRPLLKIFGSGDERDLCNKLSLELGIGSSVLFLGRVSQPQLWNEFRKSKALVFPSVRDTSGNVVLEAMALGTPVICFNHQGVGEITDDTCAIRIPPVGWDGAIEKFATAMKNLDSDPEMVLRLGRAGRQKTKGKYTWHLKFDAVDVIYAQLHRG